MAGVKFDITGNANGFISAARQAEAAAGQMSKNITNEGKALDDMFKKLAGAMATFTAGMSATALVKQIFDIRKEFQQLEVSFTTMLKSKEKADKLMMDAAEFAATTPFDLKGVAAGIKQNLAYGASAETVIDEMRMLGDVAAGLSVPLNDLVYLYGTLRTSGRVATVDIRQFAGRGIPIYEELAKVLGVAKNEVAGLVTAGKVGFADVEQAFKNMTSAGGMFYNLMADQSKTLQGQWSNLQDNIEMMFNKIGQSTQGVMSDALSLAGKLVENYETVGRALSVLVATYGTYKAAVMAVAAVQKLQVAAQTVQHFLELTKVMKTAAAAQRAFNLAVSANPYVLAAAALAALVSGVVAFIKHKKAAVDAQMAASRETAKEVNEVNTLVAKLKDANTKEDERVSALNRLKEIAPEVVEGIDAENTSLEKLNGNLEEYNTLKSVEIALKASDQYIDFSSAIQSVNDAKTEMTEKQAEMLNLWTDLSAKITAAIKSGEIKGDLKKYLEEFIYDPNVEIQEKVLRVTKKYGELTAQARKSGAAGALYKSDADTLGNLLERGTTKDVSDFASSAEVLAEAETGYTEAVEALRKRIHDSVALIYTDAEEAKKVEKALAVALGLEKASDAGGGSTGGKQEPDEKGFTDTSVYGEVYKKAEADWKESKKKLKAIEKDRANFTKKQYEDAAAEEKKNREYFESVGGDTKGKTNTDAKKRAEAIKKAEAAEAKVRNDAANQTLREQEDLDNQVEQARIDSMVDASEQRLAQMRLDHTKELQQIEREKEDYIDAIVAREKAIFDAEEQTKKAKDENYEVKTFDEGASRKKASESSEVKAYTQIYRSAEAQNRREEADLILSINEELLGDFMTYEQQRSAISKKYSKEREKRYQTDALGTTIKGSDGKPLLKEGVSQGNIEEINRAEQEDLAAIDQHFAEREATFQVWMNEVANLSLEQLRSVLAQAEQDLAAMEAQNPNDPNLATARAKVNTLRKRVESEEAKVAPGKRTIKEWGDLQEVLQDCVNSFDDIGESVGGVAGEVISTAGSIASSTLGMINGIVQLVDMSSKGMTATAATASTAISTVEKASVILAVISAALQIVMAIINAVKGLADKDNEKEIERLTKENEELDKSYEKLERSIEKAYSVDASNLIDQQNELLEQKKANLRLMIAEEKAKKNSDEEQIKEWEAQIDSIETSIEDNVEKAKEAITGISFDSFRDNFLDALMDAESGAEDFADNIEDTIREAMYNALLTDDAFEKQLTGLYDDLAAAIEAGDTREIDRIKSAILNLYDEQEQKAREIDEKLGYEADSTREASEKGIAQASQDSVDELNGRMTAVQSHTFSINERLGSLLNMSGQMLAKLTSIDSNTARLAEIETSLAYMRSDISDILTKGIRVKA